MSPKRKVEIITQEDDSDDHTPDVQIRWKNFRGFRDTKWLTLKPITILIGPNNSGKTSLVAPLLLLNQTMLSRDIGNPLVSRGALFDSPAFEGLLPNHNRKLEMFLGLRYHIHKNASQPSALGSVPPGAFEIGLKVGREPTTPMLTRYAVYDLYLRRMIERRLEEDGRYSVSGMVRSARISEMERKNLGRSKPNHFLFAPANELAGFDMAASRKGGAVNFSAPFSMYLAITGKLFTDVRQLLDSLAYIGPIRERLKHHYSLLAEEPRTVGPTGERTANLLRQRFDELQPELDSWIKAFEFGRHLAYRDLDSSREVFMLELRDGRRHTNIADAGFGASQVLPLIVQALAAPAGSLTIAEQPEIHLNPRLQAVLADLFVSMANRDRSIVVETHSEHLLLRLRRLIAERVIPAGKVALYFVERTREGSSARRIEIQENGHIASQQWPHGFFADSLRDSFALAAAQSSQ